MAPQAKANDNINNPKLSLNEAYLLPKPDKIATHLKLLEAFYTLRKSIENQDGLFGIEDGQPIASADNDALKDENAPKDKRWGIYVQRAADRFEKWWHGPMVNVFRDPNGFSVPPSFATREPREETFSGLFLPPLDILMVWHAYMLNPQCYAEDAAVFALDALYKCDFPWVAVELAITSNEDGEFYYDPGKAARDNFTKFIGAQCQWDPLHDPPTKEVSCTTCSSISYVPWVIPYRKDLHPNEMPGTGFGEAKFQLRCNYCGGLTTRDTLKCRKLHQEARKLFESVGPPRNPRGLGSYDTSGQLRHYPIKLFAKNWPLFTVPFSSMEHAREVIEGLMLSDKVKPAQRTTFRKDRMDVRLLMRGYMETHTQFSLDLAAAVLRQATFVEKMHNIGWIHSEGLENTIASLSNKYVRFFRMIRDYPQNVCVPTLDIDLAWHTHQLDAFRYSKYCMKLCKKFIDHDDKIDETKLSTHFQWTCKMYEKLYGEVYSECMCWYCEAIREANRSSIMGYSKAVTSFYQELGGSSQNGGPNRVRIDALCDINRTPHISAHNAIRSPYVKKNLHYGLKDNLKTATKRAKKKGRPLPVVGVNSDKSPLHYSDRDRNVDAMLLMYPPYAMWWVYTPAIYPMAPACGYAAGCVGGSGFATSGIASDGAPGCCNGNCGASHGGCGGHSACGSSGAGCSGGGGCGGGGGGCGGGGGGGGGCGGGGGGGGT